MAAWPHGVAALTLAYIADDRQKGRFSSTVPTADEDTDPQLAPLVEALHRMRGSHLSELAWHYAVATAAQFPSPESELAVVVAAAHSAEGKAARVDLEAGFRQNHPDHPYATWIEEP